LHHQDKPSARKRQRHPDQTMDEHTDVDVPFDPKRRKRDGSEAEIPVDTDPTDMQYIRDEEYCVHILAEQFTTSDQPPTTKRHATNHPWPNDTTPDPAPGFTTLVGSPDPYTEQYATQPHLPQRDHTVVGIYDPDDGNPMGFTTPWQRPTLQADGLTLQPPADYSDSSPPFRIYDPDGPSQRPPPQDLRP
jgi:hypothetical protein